MMKRGIMVENSIGENNENDDYNNENMFTIVATMLIEI